MDNIKIENFDLFNVSKSMSNGSSKLTFIYTTVWMKIF
jgi:hypothetical protein